MGLNCTLWALMWVSSKLEERLRNYSSLICTSPLSQGTISNWTIDSKGVTIILIISTSSNQVTGLIDSKCAICIWKLLLWTHIMQSKELSIQDSGNIGVPLGTYFTMESLFLETKMKFSRWMHTLTLGVKQLNIKSNILGWFWRQTLDLVVMSKQ